MKILGINPKDYYTGWPVQSDFGRELYRTPALTFPVLKQLIPERHEVRFLEGFFDPVPMREYNALLEWPEVVGMNIASSYGSINYAILLGQIRRKNPDAFVMAGGHHANMYPERWLDMGVDLIVKGEAELTFAGIVEEIEGGRKFDNVPGVIFKRDGEYVETESPPQIETLDESPIPDYDLINFGIYPALVKDGGGYVGSLETSRGCMFRCRFCAVPPYWQGTQRYKSPGRAVKEVELLKERNVRQINIVDDGFGNDEARLHELLEAFIAVPDMPAWTSFLRVDTLLHDPGIVEKLARAGMKATLLGYESLDEEVLRKTMGKGMRGRPVLPRLQEIYREFRKHGIMVIGVFISGHPDIPSEKDTKYMTARKVCDDPRMADYMPFPRSIGWDELCERFDIKDMFFHDAKLQVFPEVNLNAIVFNMMNILDLPRTIRMLTGGPQYRKYLTHSHRMLWSKLFRLDRRKLRDFMLLRRKNMTSDEKQKKLFEWYVEDPEYQRWLDQLEDKVWF